MPSSVALSLVVSSRKLQMLVCFVHPDDQASLVQIWSRTIASF